PRELEREPGLDGDVVGKFTEVDLAVVPEPQRFSRRVEQRDRLVLTMVTVGVAPDELRKTRPAESAERVRVPIAGGQQLKRRVLDEISVEAGVPGRAEQLEIAVEPGNDRR